MARMSLKEAEGTDVADYENWFYAFLKGKTNTYLRLFSALKILTLAEVITGPRSAPISSSV